MAAIWLSDAVHKLQILSDGFDSLLEPIAFDTSIYVNSKNASSLRNLSQSVEFSVQCSLKITSVIIDAGLGLVIDVHDLIHDHIQDHVHDHHLDQGKHFDIFVHHMISQ